MTKDEALRLALEALEVPWNAPYVDGCDLALGKKVKAITAIKAALEAKDEPVAWLCRKKSGGSLFVYTEEQLHELGYGNISVPPFDKVSPLYTTPPQRTWVGLTDEEITQIIETGLNIRDSIETALDKLKEKNT